MLRGRPLTLRLQGPAGQAVTWVGSVSAVGAPACPPLIAPTCLGIPGPVRVLASDVTNGSGRATISIPLPLGFAPAQLQVQGVARRGGAALLSNTLTLQVLSAGSDDDQDGLTNEQELGIGTDPLNHDTDGDDLYDQTETHHGTDPLHPDLDGDGVLDGVEVGHNTDSRDADTDDDGADDGMEIFGGTDPLDPDMDDDGLLDGDELARGTSPIEPDSDGDGATDGAEVAAGTDPLDPGTTTDADLDGLSDEEEIALGTSPANPDTDGDGILDGQEIGYATDPLQVDTDGDLLSDGEEIGRGTSPHDVDTDGDLTLDGVEVSTGTNPLVPDIPAGSPVTPGCPRPQDADLTNEAIVRLPAGVPCPPPPPGTTLTHAAILGRYCVYTSPTPIDLTLLGGPAAAQHDRLALMPMTGECPSVPEHSPLEDQLEQHWRQTMEWTSGTALETTSQGGPIPRIEILDTLPDIGSADLQAPLQGTTLTACDVSPETTAHHGQRMFLIAHDLVCPGGEPCEVALRARQVLGTRGSAGPSAPRTNQAHGGSFADLAVAIVGAVDDWVGDRATTGSNVGPLILNLSVAWHPLYGGSPGMEVAAIDQSVDTCGDPTPFQWERPTSLGALLVLDALEYARCHGALVFAAAGNTTAGPKGSEGPLFPAAWEALPANKMSSCDTVLRHPRFGAANLPAPPPTLVMAVGALMPAVGATAGPEMTDAITTRPGGRPLLLANGYAGVHRPTDGGLRPGAPLTGSSVSTVIVSATAALLAARDPGLDPTAIVQALLGGPGQGDPLEQQRHAIGLPISDAFVAAAHAHGRPTQAVWIRPCALLGSFCAGPVDQASDLSPWLANPTAPLRSLGDLDPLVLPSEEAYSASLAPSLIEQPDSVRCPECVLMATLDGTLELKATFGTPVGKVVDLALRVRTASQAEYGVSLAPELLQSQGGRTQLVMRLLASPEIVSSLQAAVLEVSLEPEGSPTDGSAKRTSTVQVPVLRVATP